jgi:hypothetical protein
MLPGVGRANHSPFALDGRSSLWTEQLVDRLESSLAANDQQLLDIDGGCFLDRQKSVLASQTAAFHTYFCAKANGSSFDDGVNAV